MRLEEETKVKGKGHVTVFGFDLSVWNVCGVGHGADRGE